MKQNTELESEQNPEKPFNHIFIQLLAHCFNKHFQSILDMEVNKLRESQSRNKVLNFFPFRVELAVFGPELVLYTDTGFFPSRHRQVCCSNALANQGKQTMDFPGSLLTSTEKSGCLLDLNLYILIPSHFQQSNKSLKIRGFFC